MSLSPDMQTRFRAPQRSDPIPVDEALAIVLANVPCLPREMVSLSDALGRTLSERIVAPFNLPPFPNSAMDGYAVRSQDTQGASRTQPRHLALVEDVPAGSLPRKLLQPGQASRVMTGAPIPAGADAVAKVEQTEPQQGHVLVFSPVETGKDIRPAGEDVAEGQVAIEAGSLIRPSETGMLAALGFDRVPVAKRPAVALITTGAELVFPGQTLAPGQIYNANSFSLSAQIREAAGEIVSTLHCPDSPVAFEKALAASPDADLLFASGAVSAGLYDVVRDFILERATVHFYRVAMRPGWPTLFATYAGKPFFGIPGNPVSSMVAFELLVRPALLRMQGRRALHRMQVPSIVEDTIPSRPEARQYLRAWTEFKDGAFHSRLVGPQGSARLSTMVRANSLLIVPPGVEPIPPGQRLSALLTEAREVQ